MIGELCVENLDNYTVLVLDGAAAQAVVLVRVLGKLGWRVLTETGTRAARSRWTTRTFQLPSSATAHAKVSALRSVCETFGVALVAPSTDLTLERCYQASRPDGTIAGAHLLAPDRSTGEVFLDKLEGVKCAARHGFPVPVTSTGAGPTEVVEAAIALGFPCVIKPRRSYQPVGGVMTQLRHRVVSDRREAEAAVAALTGDEGLLPLAQQFVPGRAFAVTAVVHRRAVLAMAARETLSFYPPSGGTSVWKRTVAADSPGIGEAITLLRGVGLEGIAEVEYQVTAAGPMFMEVNPRLHGWIPLAEAARPGLLRTAVAVALNDERAEPLSDYRPGLEMRWVGGELKRLGMLVGAERHTAPRRQIIHTVWPPWRPGMQYDGLDLSDLGPLAPERFSRLLHNGSGERRA
jgi:hypothetical protein